MENNNEFTKSFKVILIGDSGVGKTAIINRFSEGSFNENHITTIGVEFCFKDIEVDDDIIRLQVWDTAGQERFRSITKSFYREAQAIIIVYAIDDTYSFQNVRTWLSEIKTVTGEGSSLKQPIIKYLVGNKADLVDTRCVSTDLGKKEADTYGIKFFETSAKISQNIEEMFTEVAKDIKANTHSAEKPQEPAGNIAITSETPKSNDGGCC